MSDLVKRCHACESINPAGAFLCQKCGADISHIVAEPEDALAKSDSPKTDLAERGERQVRSQKGVRLSSDTQLNVRICPTCQAPNPVEALSCLTCGYRFPRQGETGTTKSSGLFLLLQGKEYPLKDGDVIGRQGTVAQSVLATYPTVSRRHLEVVQEKGAWFLRPLEGVPNTTQLDGKEMPRGELVALKERHRIQVSTKLSFVCVVR